MNNSIKVILFCLSTLLLSSCASQQDTAANRRLQNLSARYNYIYNSNTLLNLYQFNLAETHAENFDQILAVYLAPPSIDYLADINTSTEIKNLNEIAEKARVIVSEKNLSNYVDDAYLLLGKTNFYKGNYYNAAAYFDYVAKAYKKDKNIYLEALNWKTRSTIQLQKTTSVKHLLDSVKIALDSVKKGKGEALATLAQMSINERSYKEAIAYLTQAIKAEKKAQNRIRWSYILAQLYEADQNSEKSLLYYSKVEKSNAPFQMYFNAKLSKIRINDHINGQASNRKQQLLKLLKDDKNLDFTDQIYYEVAEDYAADNENEKAEAYYIRSAQSSNHNNYQKGLSYLKIADLNFKALNNDNKAKLYYDSAVQFLPKTYINYAQVLKKAQRLSYLTDRFRIIAQQDSLQMAAKLPAGEGGGDLPLTAEQLLKSDQQIINAYIEIAGFYQQELEDAEEAIHVYETLLSRYPKNDHLESIYYSLYLAYKTIDIAKANHFKTLLLSEYPQSIYAKTILDPKFISRENELTTTLLQIYNEIFELYEQKAYTDVIQKVNETNQRFPGHQLQIQYDYLKAIAVGRTENLASLLQAFKSITTNYPKDSLIIPLIKDHEAYIQANLASFQQRKVALVDFDPTEPRFIAQKEETPILMPTVNSLQTTPDTRAPEKITVKAVQSIAQRQTTDSLQKPIVVANELFNQADLPPYYYVISVQNVNTSLSSSRFGIGQFNRGNYTGNNLKHQLLDIESDQLIYIGNFDNLITVKNYTNEINRQLASIMKVPAGSYQSFFISKENFDKIKDKETLNKYLEFFKTKIKKDE